MKNLNKRKILAAKVLGVGIERIVLDTSRLEEIKEAITKQDIRDLYAAGAIGIKEIKGVKTKEKRTTKRGPGKIKMRVYDRKREYVILTRKFRKYINELKKQGRIDQEKYEELRKLIKARTFKDKAHLKDYIGGKI